MSETVKQQVMEAFRKCIRVEHVKKLYREYAMMFHPDRGGAVQMMQFLNDLYHTALKAFDGAKSYDAETKKEFTYHYNQSREQSIMDKIFELIALKLTQVDIALLGTWIWITGETRPAKEALKAAGCRWHAKRQCWYWHPPTAYKTRYSGRTFEQLGQVYGYQEFSSVKVD